MKFSRTGVGRRQTQSVLEEEGKIVEKKRICGSISNRSGNALKNCPSPG